MFDTVIISTWSRMRWQGLTCAAKMSWKSVVGVEEIVITSRNTPKPHELWESTSARLT